MPRGLLFYRRLRKILPLIAVGLASEALYLVAVLGPFSLLERGNILLDLNALTNGQPQAARAVAVGIVALFLFYGFALIFASDRVPAGTTASLLGTTVFSVTLSFLYPATANDVYTYVVQGYVAVFHGLNPLVDPPARAANDAFVSYAGQWANVASPYGPLWVDVSRLVVQFSGPQIVSGILLLKLINAAAVVGSSALLTRLVGKRPAFAAVFFGWNPLVQLELVGNGHNDALMIFLLLAAVALARGRRRALGGVLLTGSILTKYLTLGALPFFLLADVADQLGTLRRRGTDWVSPGLWRGLVRAMPAILAVLVTAAALFAPYWVGPTTIQRVLDVDHNYLSSPAALTILLVPGSQHWLTIVRWAILLVAFSWLVLRQLRGTIGEQGAMFEGLFVMVLCAPHFAGWYLAVLVALAPLVGDGWSTARAGAFSLAATLTVPLWAFVWPAQSATMSLLTFHEIIVPLTFGPPLLIGAIGTVARQRRPARETVEVDHDAIEIMLESA